MTRVLFDESTCEYQIVDTRSGAVIESVDDANAAKALCEMYNDDSED